MLGRLEGRGGAVKRCFIEECWHGPVQIGAGKGNVKKLDWLTKSILEAVDPLFAKNSSKNENF